MIEYTESVRGSTGNMCSVAITYTAVITIGINDNKMVLISCLVIIPLTLP